MQHIPTVSGTSERPQGDRVPAVAYVLIVALLLIIVGLLLWPSLMATPARDSAYVNPEVRLAERFRAGEWLVSAVPVPAGPLYTKELARYQQQLRRSELAINPELKVADAFRVQTYAAQDFAHANPEVGLFQRLQEFER